MPARRILVAAVILLASAVVYLAVTRQSGGFRLDAPGVLREVQQLSELVSVKYSIQKVVGLKEDKLPFGQESILLVVQGTVLGGVDMKEMDARDIRVDGGKVFLKIPPARILHVYLDDKQTQVWDRKITWWTPWVPYNPDFERKARVSAVDSIRTQAEQMGILRDARLNAQQTIQALLKSLAKLEVVFPPT
jgi:hypothetical protein